MADTDDIGDALREHPAPRILALIKVGREDDLKSVQSGLLRCRHLSFYKKTEAAGRAFHDPHEGLRGIFQAERTELTLTPHGGRSIVINHESGLVGQIYISADLANPVFCFHAMHAGPWSDREFGEDELDAYKACLQVPEAMSAFGTHVWVLTNGQEFERRLRASCNQSGVRCRSGLVKYIDPSRVHGAVPTELSAFVKRKSSPCPVPQS
jgi:hypothetical protein